MGKPLPCDWAPGDVTLPPLEEMLGPEQRPDVVSEVVVAD